MTIIAPSILSSDFSRLGEEVARIQGYDRIPSILPTPPSGRGLTSAQQGRRRVANALAAAGYVETPSFPFTTEEQNDLRGICASGQIYQFETLVNGETVRSLWTSDCDGSKGSATANVSEVIDMFLKQIPEGRKIVSGVGLGRDETFFRL